ncbi:MAG: hypothetical protein JNL82_21715 [Myxococcales bacterium]|nr:hypothetical protein [Myxococcales bacterium]
MLRMCACVAIGGWLSASAARAAPTADEGDVEPVAAATVTTRAPAIEVTTAKRVRHDWYAGFGFGLGAGNLRPAGGGDGSRAGASLLVLARGGGRVTDKLLIGGLAVTALGGGDGGARGLSNLMAEALFFPIKDRGLGLALALGLSSTYGARATAANAATSEVEPLRGGVGLGLGLGYDFWVARRFNVGVWLRGDGSAGPVYKFRAAGSLGLAFAWY